MHIALAEAESERLLGKAEGPKNIDEEATNLAMASVDVRSKENNTPLCEMLELATARYKRRAANIKHDYVAMTAT